MLGSSPLGAALAPVVAGESPGAGLLLAAAVEVPADAARTVTVWYVVVALLGLGVLLVVAVVYGRRRRR